MAGNQEKSRKSMGIIASRERKKEFDAAVKEVMRQRKAAQNLQNAVRQSQKKARPGLQRQSSGAIKLNVGGEDNGVSAKKLNMRRATIGYGSANDLQRLRAAHRRDDSDGDNSNGGGNNNAAIRRRWERSSFAPSRGNNSEGKGGHDSNSRKNKLSTSLSASDEVKKEVIQAMNKKEGLTMQNRVSSLPMLSSQQSPRSTTLMGAVAEKTPPKRNNSWTLAQDPQSTSSSPILCGIPGIRLEDLVPTRNMPSPASSNRSNNEHGLDISGKSGSSAERRLDGMVNQWKTKSLKMYPPQIDFDLGNSSSHSVPNRDAKSSTRESPPPSAVEQDDNGDCPRKKFLLFSSGESKSGGTGSTSRGSMFSSRGSLAEPNTNPVMVPPIAAIEEEDRPRHQGGEGGTQSIQSTASKFSLQSLRNRKFRRSRRLSQIRKSITNTLTGKNDGVPLVIDGQHNNDDEDSDDIISQSQSSRISSVDAEKVRHHLLERKASTKSITSAYSTVSQTSNTKNENEPPGWRFRLRKGGRRNQSMSAISIERPSRRGSNGSRRSIDSGWLDDDSSSGSSFTDFYDNELHTGLMRSIISQSSARSLGLSLPTVVERWTVEQKEEESIDDIIASELIAPKNENDISDRSDDTADSLYRHPAHDHPLLHLRPNQLFPESPGWRCDLCTQDTTNLNEWAYVSTGKNYLLCERCFSQDGVSIVAN